MKKIIQSSLLIAGIFFISAKANAQLSSDKPAMTAQQVEAIRNTGVVAKTNVTTPVVASTTTVSAVPVRMIIRDSSSHEVKPVTTAVKQVSASPAKPTLASMQDKMKPGKEQ